MKSLIGLLLTLVAVNGAFLGANKCSTGPSYWCTSFQNAKRCGETHHCVENVWRNLKPKSSKLKTAPVPPKARDTIECILCEFIMEELKRNLPKNATEAEITAEVEKVCSRLPAPKQKECDTFIEKYGKLIIRLLVADVVPSTICTIPSLCSSGDSIYMKPLPRGGSENCIMCELVMSYVKSTLSDNATQEEAMNTLEKMCTLFSGQMAQECNTMVKEDGPKLLNMLAKSLDSDKICSNIGLCTGQADGLVHLYARRSNDV